MNKGKHMNANTDRLVKGVVCFRNSDGSFSDDVREIYCDEPQEEMTELEKRQLEYFAAKVLAPMFYEDVKKRSERGKANNEG